MKTILYSIYNTLLDALFPLSTAEKDVLTMTPQNAFSILARSPQSPIDDVQSVFAYKDERVSKLIWNIKYKKSNHSTQIAAYALYETLKSNLFNVAQKTVSHPMDPCNTSFDQNEKILIIPMPITERRRRERGYNQCELITDELSRLIDSDNDHSTDKSSTTDENPHNFIIRNDILLRTLHASRQTLKNRADRLSSAKGIFSVNESAIQQLLIREQSFLPFLQNQSSNACVNANSEFRTALTNWKVIIIDDVITTGSTMKEAMETMRKAGFQNVSGLSVAH